MNVYCTTCRRRHSAVSILPQNGLVNNGIVSRLPQDKSALKKYILVLRPIKNSILSIKPLRTPISWGTVVGTLHHQITTCWRAKRSSYRSKLGVSNAKIQSLFIIVFVASFYHISNHCNCGQANVRNKAYFQNTRRFVRVIYSPRSIRLKWPNRNPTCHMVNDDGLLEKCFHDPSTQSSLPSFLKMTT